MEKVLGTNIQIYGEKLQKLKKLGYIGTHNQFRIICKCKSMADANRKVQSILGYSKVFESAYTTETGNDKELSLCNTSDIWIRIDRDNYVSIETLLSTKLN